MPSPDEHKGRDRAEVLAEAFVAGMEADFDLSSYQWIGASLLNDTLPVSLGVLSLIHQRYPNAILLAGNHESTVNPDVLSKSQLNAVILADAEEAVESLMRGIEPSKIPGVIWRNFNPKPPREKFEEWNRLIRWGEIPYESYWRLTRQLYPLDKMSEEERLETLYKIHCVRVHSLLSCELPCTFCSVSQTRRIASGSSKPSIVNLSPAALEENLLAIKKQVPGVMTIYDSCDEAWLGRGRAMEYLDVLERIKPVMDEGLPLGMRWLIQCRTNDLSEEIIDRASKCGVKHITIGVESPVEQVRKDIKKPQSEELIRNVARWCTARGVDAYMLFIAYLPSVTIEQLHEAVVNWREYMRLGATVSIEPFAMCYLATTMSEDATLLTEHVNYDIPFSGTPARKLKWATLIWPHDRRVCQVLQWTRENLDDFIEQHRRTIGHSHMYKGETGQVIVDCIEHALKMFEAGKLPPWEPGEGRRSMVYQDYGDQASGSEVAAAARNRTTTRYNSTHAKLDDSANNGLAGRIKDPALPHEMLPKPEDNK